MHGVLTTMGMDNDLQKFIRSVVQTQGLQRGFSVCDLGNLWLYENMRAVRPAREFYAELGCGGYLCLDGNGEDDALVVDLNKQVPVDYVFDIVTDLGTGEHVFDQAQVFRTVHDLLKVRGVFVFDRPTQRWRDHGFYNMQPNLIRALCAANDYELIALREHEFKDGALVYGAYRKLLDRPFVVPQQGRYLKTLKV